MGGYDNIMPRTDIVEGRTDIKRDPYSGAIISVDDSAHAAAVSGHRARQIAKEQLKNNTDDINIMKNELTEIKTMLRTLIDGR